MTEDPNDAGTELAKATAAVNVARHVEIEENNVASINDMIVELDLRNAELETNIERCQDTMRANRKEIRHNVKRQERLRLQRDIFEESAMRLRKANHP